MKKVMLGIAVLLLCSFMVVGCARSDPRDRYSPVRVVISYELGAGTLISKTPLQYGETGKSKSKKIQLPAKIWTYETAKLPLQFELGDRAVYGQLEVQKSTQFTNVGAVRMELTQEHVEKARAGQVIEVTVRDPQDDVTVARLLLGDSPMGW